MFENEKKNEVIDNIKDIIKRAVKHLDEDSFGNFMDDEEEAQWVVRDEIAENQDWNEAIRGSFDKLVSLLINEVRKEELDKE